MPLLTNELPTELPTSHHVPCLSLYQPTHRRYPENQQDPIRFRNLMKQLEQSLRRKYPKREVRTLLQPFDALASAPDFWNHTADGLAVLSAPDMFRIYKLQRPVAELAIAADNFHTKPLLRTIQSADRYQVLGLNRGAIKLFEGNRDALDEIDLAPQVPRTITDALGEELSEPHKSVRSTGAGGAMHHGHGGKKDEVDIDMERFFRAIDRSILEHHSRPSGLPLMVAALPDHLSVFRKISQNPFLMNEGIKIHPDALSTEELRKRAWSVVEPQYQARLAELVEEFGQAKSRGLAGEELEQVSAAAFSGRVTILLIEAEREIPGRINAVTGHVEFGDLSNPEVDDLLDDFGEMVLSKGGRVVVIPAESMPSTTGVAAIYRY